MLPVLFAIGKLSVSSFGVFLALGFLAGVFFIWRLSRAWDLDEEKILDSTLLTFLGGLIGSRIYFAINHWQEFASNLFAVFLFNKIPGFSFWGAFLGGWLTLYFLSRRIKIDFFQIADIASVGFIIGLIFSSLGCFFSGCSLGVTSNFLGVNMVGQLGRRFPVQALEALLLLIVLFRLWSAATHFHQRGKILSLSLIYIGIVKLLMEPLKVNHDEGIYLSAVFVILGFYIFYKVTKRNLKLDLNNLLNFFTDSRVRTYALSRFFKYWYNQKTSFSWKFRNLKKGLRRANVRVSLKNDKLY